MLSKAQQRVLDAMEPGKTYRMEELKTSRSTLNALIQHKKVRKLRDPAKEKQFAATGVPFHYVYQLRST